MLGKYKMQGMDYSLLVKKVVASTIGYNLVPAHPMNPPSRVMPYMDFQFVSSWWIKKYEHTPGAIRVKIKDTFDNILNLIENPGIIVASILDFKIDVQFAKGCALWGVYRNFGNNILGLSDAQINYFNTLNSFGIVDQNPKNIQSGLCISEQYSKIKRDTLILFDVIIYAPYTKFVKRNAIANHNKSYWKEDLLVDYTCKRLIEDIFRTKRDC